MIRRIVPNILETSLPRGASLRIFFCSITEKRLSGTSVGKLASKEAPTVAKYILLFTVVIFHRIQLITTKGDSISFINPHSVPLLYLVLLFLFQSSSPGVLLNTSTPWVVLWDSITDCGKGRAMFLSYKMRSTLQSPFCSVNLTLANMFVFLFLSWNVTV